MGMISKNQFNINNKSKFLNYKTQENKMKIGHLKVNKNRRKPFVLTGNKQIPAF